MEPAESFPAALSPWGWEVVFCLSHSANRRLGLSMHRSYLVLTAFLGQLLGKCWLLIKASIFSPRSAHQPHQGLVANGSLVTINLGQIVTACCGFAPLLSRYCSSWKRQGKMEKRPLTLSCFSLPFPLFLFLSLLAHLLPPPEIADISAVQHFCFSHRKKQRLTQSQH